MGRQRDSKLVGTVKNIIFYNLRGEYYMRSKPTVVKQTKSSVHSSLNFGKASKICKQIRNLIAPINTVQSDLGLMFRLTGALNKFIAWKEKMNEESHTMPIKLPYINGFQFNDQADLTTIRSVQPTVKSPTPEQIEISFSPFIPGQSLQAPPNTVGISFKIMLISANLNNAEVKLLGTSEINIPVLNELFQPPSISLESSSNPGDLQLIVMSIQYMVNKNDAVEISTILKKMPCGVVWARY